MIARLAWYSALAAVAAVTASVQLDRQSAIVPSMASLTPEPARAFAQAQIAAQTLRAGPPERALVEARTLVERRPIPAEALRLLAQAQLAAGKEEEGFITIQVAAKRGWRDPVAQEAMLRLAVAVGDEAEAARRYTALMLQSRTEDALLTEFGEVLCATGDGAAARSIVDVLAGTDRWTNAFVARGARVLPPEAYAEIIAEALDKGAEIDCDQVQRILRPLGKRSEAATKKLERTLERTC